METAPTPPGRKKPRKRNTAAPGHAPMTALPSNGTEPASSQPDPSTVPFQPSGPPTVSLPPPLPDVIQGGGEGGPDKNMLSALGRLDIAQEASADAPLAEDDSETRFRLLKERLLKEKLLRAQRQAKEGQTPHTPDAADTTSIPPGTSSNDTLDAAQDLGVPGHVVEALGPFVKAPSLFASSPNPFTKAPRPFAKPPSSFTAPVSLAPDTRTGPGLFEAPIVFNGKPLPYKPEEYIMKNRKGKPPVVKRKKPIAVDFIDLTSTKTDTSPEHEGSESLEDTTSQEPASVTEPAKPVPVSKEHDIDTQAGQALHDQQLEHPDSQVADLSNSRTNGHNNTNSLPTSTFSHERVGDTTDNHSSQGMLADESDDASDMAMDIESDTGSPPPMISAPSSALTIQRMQPDSVPPVVQIVQSAPRISTPFDVRIEAVKLDMLKERQQDLRDKISKKTKLLENYHLVQAQMGYDAETAAQAEAAMFKTEVLKNTLRKLDDEIREKAELIAMYGASADSRATTDADSSVIIMEESEQVPVSEPVVPVKKGKGKGKGKGGGGGDINSKPRATNSKPAATNSKPVKVANSTNSVSPEATTTPAKLSANAVTFLPSTPVLTPPVQDQKTDAAASTAEVSLKEEGEITDDEAIDSVPSVEDLTLPGRLVTAAKNKFLEQKKKNIEHRARKREQLAKELEAKLESEREEWYQAEEARLQKAMGHVRLEKKFALQEDEQNHKEDEQPLIDEKRQEEDERRFAVEQQQKEDDQRQKETEQRQVEEQRQKEDEQRRLDEVRRQKEDEQRRRDEAQRQKEDEQLKAKEELDRLVEEEIRRRTEDSAQKKEDELRARLQKRKGAMAVRAEVDSPPPGTVGSVDHFDTAAESPSSSPVNEANMDLEIRAELAEAALRLERTKQQIMASFERDVELMRQKMRDSLEMLSNDSHLTQQSIVQKMSAKRKRSQNAIEPAVKKIKQIAYHNEDESGTSGTESPAFVVRMQPEARPSPPAQAPRQHPYVKTNSSTAGSKRTSQPHHTWQPIKKRFYAEQDVNMIIDLSSDEDEVVEVKKPQLTSQEQQILELKRLIAEMESRKVKTTSVSPPAITAQKASTLASSSSPQQSPQQSQEQRTYVVRPGNSNSDISDKDDDITPTPAFQSFFDTHIYLKPTPYLYPMNDSLVKANIVRGVSSWCAANKGINANSVFCAYELVEDGVCHDVECAKKNIHASDYDVESSDLLALAKLLYPVPEEFNKGARQIYYDGLSKVLVAISADKWTPTRVIQFLETVKSSFSSSA